MQKRREYRPLSEISALDQQAVAAEARVQLLRQQSSSSFTSGSTRLSLRSSVSSVASEDDDDDDARRQLRARAAAREAARRSRLAATAAPPTMLAPARHPSKHERAIHAANRHRSVRLLVAKGANPLTSPPAHRAAPPLPPRKEASDATDRGETTPGSGRSVRFAEPPPPPPLRIGSSEDSVGEVGQLADNAACSA